MEYVARKAAATAGDLRLALKICQRSIDIVRSSLDKKSRFEKKVKIGLHHINKAVNEYRETPFVATLSRSCLLDKAILVAICRHTASTGTFGMTCDDLICRLSDLVAEIRTDPKIQLIVPPMTVIIERVDNMMKRGILLKANERKNCSVGGGGGKDNNINRITPFTCRVQMTDIKVILIFKLS